MERVGNNQQPRPPAAHWWLPGILLQRAAIPGARVPTLLLTRCNSCVAEKSTHPLLRAISNEYNAFSRVDVDASSKCQLRASCMVGHLASLPYN
jgi:hypothetical protein